MKTIRRFAFEVANVDEHLALVRAAFEERLGASFLPRVVELEDGTTIDGVSAIVQWSEGAAPTDMLWLVGPEGSGRSSLLLAAATALAARYETAPETTRPILSTAIFRRGKLARLLRDAGLAILGDTREDEDEPLDLMSDLTGRILKRSSSPSESLPPEARASSTLYRLLDPLPSQVAAWLGARIPTRAAALSRLVRSTPELGSLLTAPRGLASWTAVLRDSWPSDATGDAELVALLVSALLAFAPSELSLDPILDRALEDFAIGRCSPPDDPRDRASSAWNDLQEIHGWVPIQNGRFQNTLLRDYFLAHKIIADVRAGRREILTRHQFPRELVLLFLAVLSPEVAALAGEDRSRAMHDEIAAEIEREVQLALTHNLKHPIARIRGALADVRKKLPPAERERVADDLAQVEDATRHIAALVEKTSQWSQIPEEPLELVALSLAIRRALEPFQREWPEVQVRVDVTDDARVHVGPITLQTILSNLLENAFQAVDANGDERAVTARVSRTGDTVRIEVIDTGPGVHPDDRDRIFRPRVTTKKGGRGRPRGTGMGLPIARKYAEHIGGRVWLYTEASQTTFVLELVPAPEAPHDG